MKVGSSGLLEAMLAESSTGILAIDGKGLVEYCNRSLLAVLNLGPGSLVGKISSEVLKGISEKGTQPEELLNFFQERGAGHNADSFFEFQLKDGRTLEVHRQTQASGGRSAGELLHFRDITEKNKKIYDLKVAAVAFESRLGKTITDAGGVIIKVNESFTRITGYEAWEILGKTHRVLQSGCQTRSFYENMFAELRDKHYWEGEIWNRRKNGEVYPQWLTIKSILDERGVLTHYVSTFSDSSVIKKNEESLHISQRAIASISQGVLLTDPERRILSANAAFTKITGYTEKEVLGRDCRFLQGPLTNPETAESIRKSLREEKSFVGEILNYRKDGTTFWNELTLNPVHDHQGRLTHFIGIQRDVSDRRRFDELLRLRQLELIGVINSLPGPVARLDAEYRFQFINDKYEVVFGKLRSEIIGKTIAEVSGVELFQRLLPKLDRVMAGESFSFESTTKIATGEEIHWKSHFVPDFDLSGKARGFFVIAFDVSDIRAIEKGLRESEEKFRSIFETGAEGIALNENVYNEKGEMIDYRILEVNQAFYTTADYRGREVVGKLASEVYGMTPESIRAFWEIHRAVNGVRRTELFSPLNHKYFYVSTSPFHKDRFVSSYIDITERRLAEIALEKSQARLKLLIQASNIGLWDWDLETNEVFLSPEWKLQLGYLDDELPNRLESWSERLHDEDRERILRAVHDYIDGKINSYVVEFRLRNRKNEWTWVLAYGELARDEKGKAVRLMGCHIDITERKEAEEKIKAMNVDLEKRVLERTAELEKLQEKLLIQERMAVLGALAGSVAHELRNPLGVISNSVYFLKMVLKDAPEKVREYLGMIESETRTSDKIITDLLNYSSSKSSERKQLLVSEVIRQTLEKFPPPPGVHALTKLEDPEYGGYGGASVFADQQHLLQVFANLVVNAYQAMPDGGTLTVSCRREGSSVCVDFQDTGTGIPEENLGKIFQPLFTTKIKGIGLGLAVCKKLLEANGGDLSVESRPGAGARFQVCLPLEREDS